MGITIIHDYTCKGRTKEDKKMNTMNIMTKSLVMALSLFFLGSNAYAAKAVSGYSHGSGSRTIEIPIVNTKEKAYSLGFEELQKLTNLQSGMAISDELRLNLEHKKEKESVTIEGANVTVQELMNEQGEMVYRGMVNITYHYSIKLDSN